MAKSLIVSDVLAEGDGISGADDSARIAITLLFEILCVPEALPIGSKMCSRAIHVFDVYVGPANPTDLRVVLGVTQVRLS